ncbi:hypothetical protein Rsub_13248 [Raphidocelis subcapitata]|uniref:Uncharacterized protein n=1 Tax=Raphidocelis subcapitata TaxID=307507 RepID=A0A2V0PLA4_9CHLO|nr:hypothetical protein Rsub_13248 [Raphidocelis subcapitata]|eukprot:GBG00552.1 hypothetical protein Rsub_13248 [Raphidocelis subcapitata]
MQRSEAPRCAGPARPTQKRASYFCGLFPGGLLRSYGLPRLRGRAFGAAHETLDWTAILGGRDFRPAAQAFACIGGSCQNTRRGLRAGPCPGAPPLPKGALVSASTFIFR